MELDLTAYHVRGTALLNCLRRIVYAATANFQQYSQPTNPHLLRGTLEARGSEETKRKHASIDRVYHEIVARDFLKSQSGFEHSP